MNRSKSIAVAVCVTVVFALFIASAPALVIDDFTTGLNVFNFSPGPSDQSGYMTAAGSHVLGGYEDVTVHNSSGSPLYASANAGQALLTEFGAAQGSITLEYDGDSTPGITPTGLGGQDLVSGGTYDSIQLMGNTYVSDITLTMTAWDMTGASHAVVESVAAGQSFNEYFDFSQFTGVNMADVGALSLQVAFASPGGSTSFNTQPLESGQHSIPEPATFTIMGLLLGMGGIMRRFGFRKDAKS